jgi:predicted PurR-regulated permease PerM
MSTSAEDTRPRLLGRIASLLWVMVIAIVVGFFYFASSLWVTFLLAAFLAICVDPLVTRLEAVLPRPFAASLVLIIGMLFVGSMMYLFYGKAADFVDLLPEYAEKIHKQMEPLANKIQKAQEDAGKLNPAPAAKRVPEVRIRETTSWTSYLARGVGSVGGAVVIAGVVPFLVFFMLVRKEHIYTWLLNTFGAKTDMPLFVTRVSRMVRGFVGGNLVVGSILAALTVGVLLTLRLPGAVAIGVASGLLNLIPFAGIILAAAVPLLAATLQYSTAGPFLIIGGTVVALHLVSANLLIPKFIGSRVNIGPVAATVGMLFWSWVWGAVGLLLAVPLTAFVKLVADCNPSLIHISNLLAETPRPMPRWAITSGVAVSRAIPFLRAHFRAKAKS